GAYSETLQIQEHRVLRRTLECVQLVLVRGSRLCKARELAQILLVKAYPLIQLDRRRVQAEHAHQHFGGVTARLADVRQLAQVWFPDLLEMHEKAVKAREVRCLAIEQRDPAQGTLRSWILPSR